MELRNPSGSSAQASKPGGSVRQAWRPKAVERSDSAETCPHCGGAVKPGSAICPHCGRSLTPGKCSFCGAPMKPNAKFCTSCGQSREGIVCPECGTLNARNFCRKCNAALTPTALRALEAAKADPAFKAIQAKADELAELHARIVELRNTPAAPEQTPPELSQADLALLDEYAELLGALGSTPPAPKPVERVEVAPAPAAPTPQLDLDSIMAAYREKAAEMNAALAALVPPAGSTPEQQRDYFAARKVMRSHTSFDMSGYRPTVWVCNYCGCRHDSPTECAEPQLGGTWVYQTPEEYVADNPYVDTITTYTLE